MIEAIKQSNTEEAQSNYWENVISKEIMDKELSKEKFIKIIKMSTKSFPREKKEHEISASLGILSAKVVANIITTTPLLALSGCKVTKFFNWSRRDENTVNDIREFHLKNLDVPSKSKRPKLSARHIVAAAVIQSSLSGEDIEAIFKK